MNRPEPIIQRAVIAHLQRRAVPGLVFLHPANGGFRTAAEVAIFRGLGVRPGASDLLELDGKDWRRRPIEERKPYWQNCSTIQTQI